MKNLRGIIFKIKSMIDMNHWFYFQTIFTNKTSPKLWNESKALDYS